MPSGGMQLVVRPPFVVSRSRPFTSKSRGERVWSNSHAMQIGSDYATIFEALKWN